MDLCAFALDRFVTKEKYAYRKFQAAWRSPGFAAIRRRCSQKTQCRECLDGAENRPQNVAFANCKSAVSRQRLQGKVSQPSQNQGTIVALNQYQLNLLRTLCQQNPGPAGAVVNVDLAALNWGIQANQCACWRWASSGLSLNINEDPAQMFNAIFVGAALNAGSAWANNVGAQNYAVARHAEYQQYAANNYQALNGVAWNAWFDSVTDTVARRTCELAGLPLGASPPTAGVRYFVTMHFDRVSGGQNNAPNYTHWWLTIDLGNGQYCCLEMFPQATNLTFRFNNVYAAADNILVEVTDLAPNHMLVLNAILPQA